MQEQEYFHVFEAILYAAIITQFLVGWSKMIVERGSYKIYWVHILLTIDLFLFVVQRYYSFRSLNHYELVTNSFSFLIVVIVAPALVFISAFIMFPNTNSKVDFRDLIVKVRFPLVLALIWPIGFNVYRNLELLSGTTLMLFIPHMIIIASMILFMLKKSLRVAAFGSVFTFIAISYFLWVA